MAVEGMEKLAMEQQLDAENAVIGSLLIDSSLARDIFAKVDAKDFQHERNRQIFQVARALFRAGEPVTAVSIRDRLGEDWTGYLMQLMEITVTSANWEAYAGYMRQQATLRRLKDMAQVIAEAATLDACRNAVADMGQQLSGGQNIDAWTMPEMLEDFFNSQEPDREPVKYITCGIQDIDQGTYTEPGDVLMIGGYPSDGKTALALMMAYHMAASHKVGFFSLETDKRKIRDRMVAHVAQIDFNAIKRRTLTESDWAALAEKSADIAKRDLTVLRASGMTSADIQAVSQAYGFEVIFIDYVQLVVPETDRRAPRSDQMADVSRTLHTFAQKSGTLVVELAQLTRQERSGGWREPDMHDLKESGQFEQDADIIYLLFRPNPKSDELDQEKNRILKVAKNKEGRRGKWPLYFDGERQTFSTIVPGGVSGDGKEVLRSLVNAGKQAKQKNRLEVRGQQSLAELKELPESEAKGLPF